MKYWAMYMYTCQVKAFILNFLLPSIYCSYGIVIDSIFVLPRKITQSPVTIGSLVSYKVETDLMTLH